MRRILCGLLLSVALLPPLPSLAEDGDGSHDVSYLWTPDRAGAEAYLGLVAEVLGPDVERDLQIVIGGTGNFGVIYDRGGTDAEEARRVAKVHHKLLRQAFGGNEELAVPIPDRGYSRLLHVRYGEATGFEECRERFDRVAEGLGSEVARELVVVRSGEERYELVFPLFGTPEEADQLAGEHSSLLDGIVATPARADGGAVAVWDASSVGAEAEPTCRTTESESESEPTCRTTESETEPMCRTTETETEHVVDFTSTDMTLRNAINDHIQALRANGFVESDERTAWVVYDLSGDRALAAINADAALQCASMVKPLAALAFFHEVERGRFIYGDKSRGKMERMIQSSDNDATNWVIDQVGGPAAVQRILEEEYGELLSDVSIVERIPAGGRTYRNRASAADYTRFLRALWRRELPGSDELLRLMNLPNGDRIYRGVPTIPVGTHVYDKTGTTSMLCGDMGILVATDQGGKRVPYAVVAIIEKGARPSSFRRWVAQRGDVIRGVSGLVYRRLRETHTLR